MQPIIYLDSVFIINLILDELILTLTCHFTGNHTTFFRKTMGAAIGSGMYCMTLYLRAYKGREWILPELLALVIMYMVSVKKSGIRAFLKFTGYFFSISFLLGGAMLFLIRRFCVYSDGVKTAVVILTGCAVTITLELFWKNIRMEKRFCQVSIPGDDGEICIRALIDTGNGLVDPVSGKKAAILEEEVWNRMASCKKEEKYKILPYSSIGKKRGVLEGYEINELTLGEQSLQHMIVAIYPGRLSGRRSYQMILPPEWICQEINV